MILHKKCPLCGSTSLIGFAIDTKRRGPHISRVKCTSCKLVFANPMADEDELNLHYNDYYEKDHFKAMDYKKIILDRYHLIKKLQPDGIGKDARYLKLLKSHSKFLDVGCGLGLGLAYANQLNCDLYATEFDEGALNFVKEHFSVKTYKGDLLEAQYPDNFFDFVHISHVIEHVIDPRAYVREMIRILKPGGYLAIGTPDISSNLYRIHRWINLLQLKVPDIVDGLEHTFIFPKSGLDSLCTQEGLEVMDHFTHSLGERISNLRQYQIPLSKKLNRLIQNAFHVNQWIVCKK